MQLKDHLIRLRQQVKVRWQHLPQIKDKSLHFLTSQDATDPEQRNKLIEKSPITRSNSKSPMSIGHLVWLFSGSHFES